jgi:hypothetical protein
MSTIEELRIAYVEKQKIADDAQMAAVAARAEWYDAMCDAHPIQPGDILTSSKGEKAKVVRLSVKYDEILWTAMGFKKDGTVGLREVFRWRPEWRNPTVTKAEAP